jgi:D-alanyl-D-alanine carboxypeptidase
MLCALTIRALEDFQAGFDALAAQNLPVVSARVIEQDNRDPLQADDALSAVNVNKMLTDAVILQLTSEGTLTLDDTLAQWLPEVAVMLPGGDVITLRQLLGSGGEVAREGNWSHGSANVILLGIVIEAATGQSLAENYHTRILDAMEMTQTHLTGSEVSYR